MMTNFVYEPMSDHSAA